MVTICPTITASDPHQYRTQIEHVAAFAHRLHLDFMDGAFTPAHSIAIEQAWWPDTAKVDLHLMYKKPADFLQKAINQKPRLVIVHAEAEGSFADMAKALHDQGIKAGIALLQKTNPEVIRQGLDIIDHVLIFSGKLGFFGGKTDLKLLDKVRTLKKWKPELEIGWDGGVDDSNLQRLIEGGVDVLNVGGFIQRNAHPADAYATLYKIANSIKT